MGEVLTLVVVVFDFLAFLNRCLSIRLFGFVRMTESVICDLRRIEKGRILQ